MHTPKHFEYECHIHQALQINGYPEEFILRCITSSNGLDPSFVRICPPYFESQPEALSRIKGPQRNSGTLKHPNIFFVHSVILA